MNSTGRPARWILPVVGLLFTAALAGSATGSASEPRPGAETGRERFLRDCATCHGPRGQGSTRGPSLQGDGPAAVDFYVSTGRMPPPGQRRLRPKRLDPDRREAIYTEQEIDELVGYVSTFIGGPPVPEVETDEDLVATGGRLYRLNCASCHQFAGVGGVLAGGQQAGAKQAPTLHFSTPVQTFEAIRVGPGTMPAFSDTQLSDEEVNAITTYVEELQRPEDEGGVALLHYGPVMEGFVAWFVGLGVILIGARWVGKRT